MPAARDPAPGVPTYTLWIDSPARGGVREYWGRNVSMPGMYVRQRDDPACWGNSETNTKICAW